MKIKNIIAILILFVGAESAFAQNKELKFKLINFLMGKGELSKTEDKSKFLDDVFIVRLVRDEHDKNRNNICLYRCGIQASDSFYYLLLKKGDKYEIIDVKELDKVLANVIDALKKSKRSPSDILKNIEAIIIMYQINQKAIPWKNSL